MAFLYRSACAKVISANAVVRAPLAVTPGSRTNVPPCCQESPANAAFRHPSLMPSRTAPEPCVRIPWTIDGTSDAYTDLRRPKQLYAAVVGSSSISPGTPSGNLSDSTNWPACDGEPEPTNTSRTRAACSACRTPGALKAASCTSHASHAKFRTNTSKVLAYSLRPSGTKLRKGTPSLFGLWLLVESESESPAVAVREPGSGCRRTTSPSRAQSGCTISPLIRVLQRLPARRNGSFE